MKPRYRVSIGRIGSGEETLAEFEASVERHENPEDAE